MLAAGPATAFSIKNFTKKVVRKVKKETKKAKDKAEDVAKKADPIAEAVGKQIEKLPANVEKQLDSMGDFFEQRLTDAITKQLRSIARGAVADRKQILSILASSGGALVKDASMRATILRMADPRTERSRAKQDLATVRTSPHTQRLYALGKPNAPGTPDKLDSFGAGIPQDEEIYRPYTFSMGLAAGAAVGAGADVGSGLYIGIPSGTPIKAYTSVGGEAGAVADASVDVQLGLWTQEPGHLGGCDMAVAVEGGEFVTLGVQVVFNTPCFDDGNKWNKFVQDEILKGHLKPSGYVMTFGAGGGLPVAATIAGGYSDLQGF